MDHQSRISFGPSTRGGSPLRNRNSANFGSLTRGNSQGRNTINDEEEEYNRRRHEVLRSSASPNMLNATILNPQGRPLSANVGMPGISRVGLRDPNSQTISSFNLGSLPNARHEPIRSVPLHIKEHIAHLQHDNASLMRRLNLVHQELERINREKTELSTQLSALMARSSDQYELLHKEENVDRVNKYMKDDLAYEKDRNQKLKQAMHELNTQIISMKEDIRRLDEEQQALLRQNHEIKYTLQRQAATIEDLEKEQFFNQERIRDTHLNIDQGGMLNNHMSTQSHTVKHAIDLALSERNSILERVNFLSTQYDQTAQQLSQERRIMVIENSNHLKFISAKVIFNQLSRVYFKRQTTGFNEILNYTKFDSKCNVKLKSLAYLLEKGGRDKVRICLTHWFSVALKPTEVKTQSKIISALTGNLSDTTRFFLKWRRAYESKTQDNQRKARGAQMIWKKLSKEARVEKQRALKIWRDVSHRSSQRAIKVRELLVSKHYRMLNAGFINWKNYSAEFDNQIRLSILAKSYSSKQELQIMFRAFHLQTVRAKRHRLQSLSLCLKGWRDYLAHEKYLMSQNLLAINFEREVFTSTIKASFDAFKHYKQRKLLEKTRKDLNDGELVRIRELTLGIDEMTRQRLTLRKRRGIEAVIGCMQKKLWGYINHWRLLNVAYHEKVRSTLQDRVIKLYMSWIRISFSRWKLIHSQNKDHEKKTNIRAIQGDNLNLQNDVIALSNSNADKTDERLQQRDKHLTKCIEKFEQRLLSLAMGRWRDNTTDMQIKEWGAYKIMRRLRLRLCRKAFNLYLEGVKHRNMEDMRNQRCQAYHRLRNQRLAQKVVDQWAIYKQNHIKAKDYWYRIFLRLELNLKRLSIKRWREVSQASVEASLEKHSDQIISTNDDLNHRIGQLDQTQTEQQLLLHSKKKLLASQGRLILANYFARFHQINLTRGFEKWREYSAFIGNRNQILEKCAFHIKKAEFYIVKSAFRNWIQNANILDRRDQLKKDIMKVNDTTFQRRQQESQFQDLSSQLQESIKEEGDEHKIFHVKWQNSVSALTKRVHENHLTDRKRYIFQQWSDYVRKEVYLVKCINNVLTKSLLNFGFQAIKEQSRDNTHDNLKETVLTKLMWVFKRRLQANTLSKWREGSYISVIDSTQHLLRTTSDQIDRHQGFKEAYKEHNSKRSELLLNTQLQRNTLGAWLNIVKYLKLQRQNTSKCMIENRQCLTINAITKWRQRSKITKERRKSYQKTAKAVEMLYKRACFLGFQKFVYNQREVAKRLGNLANVLDNVKLQMGYHAIKSFAKAKAFVYAKRKENAAIWFAESLSSVYIRRLNSHMTEFRKRCVNKCKIDNLKKIVVGQTIMKSLRQAFQSWRDRSDKQSIAIELYEEGPIREQDFNYKSELSNLKDMLVQEGYDDSEIARAQTGHSSLQKSLMLKVICRFQHFNSQLYTKPKMFDRWRQYVHARKLFKYWLRFVEKRSEPVKADLHIAFDKWKRMHPSQKQDLTLRPKAQLNQIAMANNKILDKLAEEIEKKEVILEHMSSQREALLDNYIKAQKLALVLWVNSHKAAKHQALLRWSDEARFRRNLETSIMLKTNLEHMEVLKQRIKDLESSNEVFALENEDLRQFSLDGYDIAKNVQALTAEREVLSVDLADKAQVIKRLLDENDQLNHKLSRAQDHAQSLIKKTMKRGDRPGSTGMPSRTTVRQ